MTSVCPKCMHKSADDERVCGRCGALLLSAAQRRDIVRGAEDSPGEDAGSESRVVSGPPAAIPTVGDRGVPKDETAEAKAIREALEYLGSSDDRRSTADRRTAAERRAASDRRATGGRPTTGRKINRTWQITLGLTLLVAVGVGLFFGLHGSSNNSPGGTAAQNGPTTTTIALFQFNGSGPSTTGPFTTSGPFTFSYTVTCPQDLASPATFQLLRAGHSVDQLSSIVGALVETGNQPSFGQSGTFTVEVVVPAACTWMIAGES